MNDGNLAVANTLSITTNWADKRDIAPLKTFTNLYKRVLAPRYHIAESNF